MAPAIPLVAGSAVFGVILVVGLGISIGIFLNWLTPILEKIPFGVGSFLSSVTDSIARAIQNACSAILGGLSSLIGGWLHAIARTIDWTYGEFRDHSAALLDVGETLV